MGKKRRLRHSKKFAFKHDNHPRMKLLYKAPSEEVVENVVEVTTTPTLTALPPEIVPEVEVVEPPLAAPTPKVRKRPKPKRKAQKVAPTPTPRAPTTKKTTSTRKRSTKTKTKTATA
jgi:hypothetical protein